MKVFCASIDHETNRFSPLPTSLDSYREGFLYRPSTGEGQALVTFVLKEANLASILIKRGHEVSLGTIAATHPSAPTNKKDYELLRDELLEDLKKSLPLDAVALRLHGAMVAEGYDDCEGDILRRARDIIGPDIPLAVLFDLHGNITREMTDNTTLLVACKEYPHTDFADRALDICQRLEEIVAGQCQPTTAFVRVPMFGIFHTTREPLKGLVKKITDLEGTEGILSISLTHGFIWGDNPHVGAGVIVITDNNPAQATEIAGALATEFFALRQQINSPVTPLPALIDEITGHPDRTYILADVSDNPGGGGAGDSTFLLQALLDNKIDTAAIGMIWDPMAVDLAHKAGLGAKIKLRIGGKIGPMSGPPVDLDVTVTGLADNLWQWAMGARDNLGRAAALEAGGIHILLCATRQQVLSPECFTEIGISLEDKKVIAVKSAHHFHATFSYLTDHIYYVGLPGTVSQNYATIDFRSLPRPLWPLDKPPFDAFGRRWA